MADHMTAEQLAMDVRLAATDMATCGLQLAARDSTQSAFDAARERFDAALARLSGMAAAPQWQPIETAPRDSSKVLVGSFNVYGEWRTYMAWWRLPYEGAPDKQCSWCYEKDGTLLDASIHSCGATHWQPLPASPEPPHG